MLDQPWRDIHNYNKAAATLYAFQPSLWYRFAGAAVALRPPADYNKGWGSENGVWLADTNALGTTHTAAPPSVADGVIILYKSVCMRHGG